MHSAKSQPIRTLVRSWLLLDFFDHARRTGGNASSLTTTIFSQSFLALIVAALLYPEPPPVPFAAANLCLSTLLAALGAFDTEQPLHRRLADQVLLGTSPLPRLPVVLARLLHVAFSTMLVTIGLALPPAILLACRQHEPWLAPAYVALACACSGLAIGTLSVALRAVRRWFGAPAAALAAGSAKAILLATAVAVFLLSLPALRADASALPIGRLGAELLPPYHAAKVLGAPGAEAWRLLLLAGLGLLLLGAAVWLGDDERQRRPRTGRGGWRVRLLAHCAGDAQTAGVAVFTATMLWRSPAVRARVLPLLGIPVAIAFLAVRGSATGDRFLFATMALQFPGIYLPFVIALLQQADQRGSRWLFDSAPAVPIRRVHTAVWLALVGYVLLPMQGVAMLALLLGGIPVLPLLAAAMFAIATAALVARVMVRALPEIPFCNDEPAKAADLGNLMAFGLVLAAAGAVAALLPLPGQFGFATVAWGALIGLLRTSRRA